MTDPTLIKKFVASLGLEPRDTVCIAGKHQHHAHYKTAVLAQGARVVATSTATYLVGTMPLVTHQYAAQLLDNYDRVAVLTTLDPHTSYRACPPALVSIWPGATLMGVVWAEGQSHTTIRWEK